MAKRLVFRWSFIHHITKKLVRAKTRPFPLWVHDNGSVTLAFGQKETALPTQAALFPTGSQLK